MTITKESFLTLYKTDTVAVEGLGQVTLKEFPASFFMPEGKGKKKDEADMDGAAMIMSSVIDEEGSLLFDPVKDRAAVLKMPTSVFQELVKAIIALNGLGKKEGEAETEAEKN